MFNSIARGSFLCLSIILAITNAGSAQIQLSESQASKRSKTRNLFNVADLKRGCCSASSKETSVVQPNNLAYESYTLAATYYSLNDNMTSTLMLNNKGPQPIDATPTFYSLAGTRLRLAPIVVPAASYLEIDLHQLLAGAGEEFREGNMKIAYQGGDYQLGAQVKLTDPQKSLIWAEQFVYTSKFTSNKLESVWWLPYQNSTTSVVVTNTSSGTVTATITVDGTSPRQTSPTPITLAPWETRVLDIMEDIVGHEHGHVHTSGGISIVHTGNPGAVLSRMFASKPERGYSASLPFVDPDSSVSQKWHGNGLRLKNLDGSTLWPVLVARNTSNQPSSVGGKIPYTLPNGEMAEVIIPSNTLAANSTRIIELGNLLQEANVPASVSYAGIELEYSTPKGTVMATLQSLSQNGNHVFQVPIFDPMKTPSSAGGYPWKADGDYSTLLYVKNETDQTKRYTAFLVFDGGSYSLGVNEIKGHQTVAVDFKRIRDEQIPDRNGSIIPLTAIQGQIAWSVSGVENKVLSGRSEQISLSRGVASTYDCRNCCPNSVYDAWLDPFSVYENIGSTTGFLANQRDISCNGQIYGPYTPTSQTWNSTNWSIASVDGYGTETGVAVGDANIQSSWDAVTWWDWGSEACDPTVVPMMAEAPVEVVPTVSKIQYKGPNNNQFADVTGTLYILKDTEVTFKAIPDPPNASFPSGTPTWSGTSGATGAGETVSVTFGSVSAGTSYFKTVIATSGNSINANIVVYELSSILTPQDNFDPSRSLIKFGLEEIVNLDFTINPLLTDEQVGGLRWTIQTGTGTLPPQDDGQGTYTAPESAESSSLKLAVLDGPAKGQFITKDITIVAPSDARLIKFGNIRHTLGNFGGGFRGNIFFDPKDVSFGRIGFREGGGTLAATGYLSVFNGMAHTPTATTIPISNCGLALGCQLQGNDTVNTERATTPYSNGTFSWPIEWKYYTTGSNSIFVTATHTCTADSSGNAELGKKNAGPFTIAVNDPTTTF